MNNNNVGKNKNPNVVLKVRYMIIGLIALKET